MTCPRLAQRLSSSKALQPTRKPPAKPWKLYKKATAGDLVLLSQDAARFSRIPTLRTTLGVQGHRPGVGPLACHDVRDVFGALDVGTGRLTTRLVERPRTPMRSPQRSRPEACARHVRDLARTSPAGQYPRGVIVSDNASWHRGACLTAVLAAFPHLELYPRPSSSPTLPGIERFWKGRRRRATPNRLFPTMAQLKQALRHRLCYSQTLKQRVLSVIQS